MSQETIELIKSWKSKFEKQYDLLDTKNQHCFFESILEITKHIAASSKSANVQIDFDLNQIFLKINSVEKD